MYTATAGWRLHRDPPASPLKKAAHASARLSFRRSPSTARSSAPSKRDGKARALTSSKVVTASKVRSSGAVVGPRKTSWLTFGEWNENDAVAHDPPETPAAYRILRRRPRSRSAASWPSAAPKARAPPPLKRTAVFFVRVMRSSSACSGHAKDGSGRTGSRTPRHDRPRSSAAAAPTTSSPGQPTILRERAKKRDRRLHLMEGTEVGGTPS